MKNLKATFSIFSIAMTIVLSTTNGFAQTEKFLKLNRIVNIDSTKSSVVPINETTVFEVTVPSGVVWKINQISTLVAAQTYQIKVGKTAFTGIASYINSGSSSGQSSYVSFGQNLGISYANSFWLTENSKVRIVGASGVGAHFLFLSAEEFVLGQ